MDRLVTIDLRDLELTFRRGHRCSTTFRVTNLMHTMSVAIHLSTTNPSLFSFKPPQTPNIFSILSPLSSSTFSLLLDPCETPPLSSPLDKLFVRSTILPTGKADADNLRQIFAKPGPHVFKDAALPISYVGEHVVEFLLSTFSLSVPLQKTLEFDSVLAKAISGCSHSQISALLRDAVRFGSPSFASALLGAGGDVNSRDSCGVSLLSLAVSLGHVGVVRVLVSFGSVVVDPLVDFLLQEAALLNRVDLMSVLLDSCKDVSVNSVDSTGQSPVHVSAFRGHLDVLRFCVASRGELCRVDFNGWTPLHCAAAQGHLETVEFLIHSAWATKYALTKDGKTPFSLAVENGHSHLLDVLRLGDVLQRAAGLGDIHGLKSYLSQGAKVNGRDQNGWTPLHRAAFKGRIEIVKLLLDHGAQLDLVDDAGYTPLHCAVEAGHAQVALYLIARGARLSVKSLKGVCPLNIACFSNHPAAVVPLCGEKERA